MLSSSTEIHYIKAYSNSKINDGVLVCICVYQYRFCLTKAYLDEVS